MNIHRNVPRLILPTLLAAHGLLAHGQGSKVLEGKPFTREMKNANGDIFTVVDGVLTDGRTALLYVEDAMVHKVLRTDAQLVPAGELALKDHAFDGLLWNGVAPVIIDGSMHCLLVSNTKKSSEFAIGRVDESGAPTLSALRRIGSTDVLYTSSPTNSLCLRPQPDPILLTKGLAFAHVERMVPAPDGRHFLLNTHTQDGKGDKRIWLSWLDKDMRAEWSATVTLPFDDMNSTIHQISVSNDGVVHLLSYVRACPEEQLSDKLCHEVYVTTISDQGKAVKNLLVDKDFISSARICERDGGKLGLALRYGALTGQPGWVMTFDPLDPKLKATPVVDQRIPSIRKTKIMAYGSIEAGAKKGTVSRTAKVPDEIVSLIPAWDGLVLVETFLETAFELPVGEAIAMRRLGGDIRTTYVGANDSIQWRHIAERAFMTTAGQIYDGVQVRLTEAGLTLLYDHTPRGLDAILAPGASPVEDPGGRKGKKDKPAPPQEPGVLKATILDSRGTLVAQGTVLMTEGQLPCPTGSITDRQGRIHLVKTFDRGTGYRFTLVDATMAGKE